MAKRVFQKKQGVMLVVLLVLSLLCASAAGASEPRKVLYIDSYFPSYAWSANITAGIRSVLGDRADINLRIFTMDTKRNKSEAYKTQVALKAKALIESFQPDVVIVSDDNGSKYLLAPYFKNSTIPFVFCGLNWDASVYGFPTKNITGMVEVSLAKQLVATLGGLAKGDRIGILAADTLSERKEAENVSVMLGVSVDARFAQTFEQLQLMFLDLQKTCDMVILLESCSVKGFQEGEMAHFVARNTSVPTGTTLKFMKRYVLVTYGKSAEEQGRYAANTALKILAGTSPSAIPVVQNREAKIYLNMKLAKELGVKFPMALIEDATLISATRPKVFYVNSYHKGYQWSDDIEKGLLRALGVKVDGEGRLDSSASGVDFKLFRMETKLQADPSYIKKRALVAREEIEDWQPDILLISDDNAAKYLVAPFYKNSIPVVFCGINWDASEYGFPTATMTGMVEVEPVEETIAMLRRYATGDRLGYIGTDNLSCRKMLKSYIETLNISFSDGVLTTSFKQWQQEYIRLQDEVDMLLWLPTFSLEGWNEKEGYETILSHTKIPVGSTADHQVRYTLMGNVKIAEEQGWWMGKTALQIIDGTDPATIPVVRNERTKLYLNMDMAKHLGVKFPMELIDNATFIKIPEQVGGAQ